MLEWLEEWYESQCDGNWEHMFVIKIETLDNPGWSITIDLEDTGLDLEPISYMLFEDEDRWLGYAIRDDRFEGASDPKNLNTLISIFKKLVEGIKIDKNDVLLSLKNNK